MHWSLISLCSAASEATQTIIEKKALHKEHAMELCSAIAIISVLLTAPLWLSAKTYSISTGSFLTILLASLTYSLSLLFIAKGLRHIASALASPFLAAIPLLTAILAWLILGESLPVLQWLGLVALGAGLFLLESHVHESLLEPFRHTSKSRYIRFILLGGLFFAISAILDKRVLEHVAVVSYVPLLYFLVAVEFIVMMLLFHDGFEGISRGMHKNLAPLFLISALAVISKSSMLLGIATGTTLALVIGVQRLSGLFASLEEGHPQTGRKLFAIVMILVGAGLLLV